MHIYSLSSQEADMSALAAAIARDVASPHADQVDSEARFPTEAISALASQGLLGLCISPQFGGKGQGPRAYAAVVEELAQACASR